MIAYDVSESISLYPSQPAYHVESATPQSEPSDLPTLPESSATLASSSSLSSLPQPQPTPARARRPLRILFTFIGGSGHFRPLIPIARAAQAAGHTVAVAGSGRRQAEVEAAGFTAFATSPPEPAANVPGPGPASVSAHVLEPPDPQREQLWLAEGFARRGARRHGAAISELARQWRPDVLVRDELDFGTAIAAESLAIPCVVVSVLAAGGFLRKELVAEPLHELRAEHGLAADPRLAMFDGDLTLVPYPPSYRDPEFPLPGQAFSFRPHDVVPRRAASDRPTVYFTLGTVQTAVDLFNRVLAGLRDLPLNVVLTVGDRLDPAELEPQPGHIRIERFVPQEELLPLCDLVISHGGSGSVLGTLAHGLPSVLLPIGADQPYNARRCVGLGVARALDPMTAAAGDVRATVSGVLADRSYRREAERLQAEYNALPGTDEALALIELLAR